MERQTERLLSALIVPLGERNRDQAVALALGLRGKTLYRAVRILCDRSMFVPAAAVMRALLDVVIVARWIEEQPDLHVRMWLGEDARQARLSLQAWADVHERRLGQTLNIEADVAKQASLEEASRAEALAAGEPISRSGPVLPGNVEMMRAVPALWELYTVVYRTLSPYVHAGGRSFVADTVEVMPEGVFLRSGAPLQAAEIRAIALPAALMLLATVSRQSGLGIEDRADEIRVAYTLWTDLGQEKAPEKP